jgi:anti-sigma regulatory factor (Ser/Thr protein kinase)
MLSEVRDSSQVGEARRLALDLASRNELDGTQAGKLALVVTEMATNLVKHGGGGTIIVDRYDDVDGTGLEVLALDKGPGMADVQQCLRDGFSTAGSPGEGLGAIARQSVRFGVFSRPGQGTVLMARCPGRAGSGPRTRSELGAVLVPYPGEIECGDAWSFDAGPVGETLLVADGSGHGLLAARAAERAIETFEQNARRECPTLAATLHRALTSTRGAAIGLARVDWRGRQIRFVGIGNIAGTVVSGAGTKRMVSHSGTAGHLAPRIAEFIYPFEGRPLLILHSDGLNTRWDLSAYPGLAQLHPSLVAGVLYRDHRRGRDDASVVVLRAAE